MGFGSLLRMANTVLNPRMANTVLNPPPKQDFGYLLGIMFGR